jgi:hypothetical protein
MDAPKTSVREWVLAAAGLLMIGAAASILIHRREPPPLPPQPVAETNAPSTVALYVQHDGPALRLHWDANAAAIRSAAVGTLTIADGPRESRLSLKPADLSSGVASYWPETSEVTFRLDLDNAPAGTIRVTAAPPAQTRPSPFEVAAKPKPTRAATTAARAVRDEDEPDDEEDAPPPPPKHSRLSRVTGKIPLLRRLHRH